MGSALSEISYEDRDRARLQLSDGASLSDNLYIKSRMRGRLVFLRTQYLEFNEVRTFAVRSNTPISKETNSLQANKLATVEKAKTLKIGEVSKLVLQSYRERKG